MEWATLHHLDLRHVGRSSKPFQPHAAAFHPTQALLAAAAGNHIIEFDAYTGCKIASVDIGSPVVRMAYSPTSGHTVIAILEDCTICSCDFESEQTCVLHSLEKRTEQISPDTEVHLALTSLQPVVFFGFHRRMSVTAVGTIEGGKTPTKIKADLKKPIVNLACHPRLPILYVAYAEGLIRAYNINTYAVLYTLQLDNTIKLVGAGAFAFHPTLEWIFVGDRRGTLLAWDVSTETPMMIGITQVGSQPITSVSWLPVPRLLVTLSKDGSAQVWKTRVALNPNRPPMQANFFESADIESIDIPHILSHQGGEAVYPLPRIKAIEVHTKLNMAALLFASMGGGENRKNRAANTREGRKQLFAVLQSARGSSASVLKEKLSALGSSGILADHQLQAQIQEHHLKDQSQLTISDIARKAFLYSAIKSGGTNGLICLSSKINIPENKGLASAMSILQEITNQIDSYSNAVGTIEGGKTPTKIKADLKKPIVNLACHPRLPILYVAYAEGLIRAYNINTYAVLYTLQLDNTIKLVGAGAFAFHPTLEWIFVGDRRGTLLAWDVSTETPMMIGITQVGSQPITSVSWLPVPRLLVTLSKDGSAQVWKTRVALNPNRPPMQANFFESAGFCPNGSQSQLTISDIARKAFLYSHFMEGHSKSAPIARLPLITILDTKNYLKNIPVCQPFHLELNFFSKENRVLHYPVRAFYLEGANVMAYNLASGSENIYKKLYTSIPGNVEFQPKYILHSKKQHLFLAVYEFSGATNEVVLYWENTGPLVAKSKLTTIKGRDAAFIGPNDHHYAILDEDRTGLSLYILPGAPAQKSTQKNEEVPSWLQDEEMENPTAESENPTAESEVSPVKGPLQFMFESEVDRIFSTPLESTLLFASHGDQIALVKLIQGYRLSNGDGHYISTKAEGRKTLKLKNNETVLQVHWQETLRGYVAGILTTQRVLIVSADLDVLASSSSKFDKGLPSYRSLLWVGPALLFSTSSAVSMLGWDGKVRTILSVSVPNAVLLGALNDQLLLANPTIMNPRQKKSIEIKSCLVGLLEPLLIGFATMQQHFEQKLDLSEVLYQITSRFDSLRITPRLLDILSSGSPVCGDLAVLLSQSGPQITQMLRGVYAVRSLRFATALSVLKDEFLRSRDYPRCPPTSHLFRRFRRLGYACIKYAQFDSAKETFEVIADYESLLDLFVCHLNPSAMRRLAQKLEEEGSDSELRRYCERILRVRSKGWTQGIFANFAAESMVPKGPEWGGGNWEIKTPINLKNIPQWELAAEVTPYMRSDDGSIPSIVTDHIGVYLGIIKGRGNIVEVGEGSLVKAFKSQGDDTKANGHVASTVASSSNKSRGGSEGENKLESLMGLETLLKQPASSGAIDEQAKAEEEFKKSLYGSAAEGSSSDEEGTSKTEKLQIRIQDKPVSSATVDLNKIKEATKQFSLPMTRTKSQIGTLSDHGLVSTQPAAATASTTVAPVVSAQADPFGTLSLMPPVSASQPPPAAAGAGVAAGPIADDFFQNTISSLHVAAALPPPGIVLSKMVPNPQAAEGNNRTPNEVDIAQGDVGLPGGGVPPQATQQSSPLKPIRLTDGGIPPQSMPATLPQSQVQLSQPISNQPLDLSALEGPGSRVSGQTPARPESPPKAVRPGQIPRGAAAPVCFKTGLAHLEQNQLPDALSCFDEGFLALAKDQSHGADIKAQATICAQYKTAVTLLREISRLQRVQGPSAVSAKDEMARLSRHLGSLPLLAKHRINCIRTAIKRNMDVQNYAYSKQMLELLLTKAPPGKQDELRSLIDICVRRGLTNKSIDPLEDPSQFCAATLSRLSTIGYDVCDLCGSKFSALSTPGCIICGMGSIKRSDALAGPIASPFG